MNNTLSNGFMLLEYLAETAQEYSIKELSELFELPNSHICRLLKTLQERGYVEQGKSRKYRVSLQVTCLSNALLKNHQLRKRCRPYLQKLQMALNTVVYLAEPLKEKTLIVDVIHPIDKNVDEGLSIGKINELNATSSGKLIAAYQPESEYKRLIEQSKPQRFTDRTLTETKDIIKELKITKKRGMAVSYGEHYPKTFSVAAPVFNFNGELAGAISTFDWNPTEDKMKQIINEVRSAAVSASFSIGYTGQHNSEKLTADQILSDVYDNSFSK